ncbi:MAG: hypothetical protein GXO32_04890 [Crenarchaeota archaeon]|nr:hypothetical protein [Thermoproteota archaeon]
MLVRLGGVRLRAVAIGLAVGLFMGFVDSYSYAVSGFTTSEISVVFIPVIVLALATALRASLTREELVAASALAIGIDITTTLTSGMYVTYGFLKLVASKLSVFGISVSVPPKLFSYPHPLDLESMPIYVSLALVSAAGVLIAYAFRMHFLEKERLLYPLGTAAAMLLRVAKRVRVEHAVAILVGFGAQLAYLALGGAMLDLTPVTSSILPGAILALSVNPIVVAVLLLVPAGSLRSISLGSVSTYLALLPIAVVLGGVAVIPTPSYDSSLLAYSNLVSSILVGAVAVLSATYLARYRKAIVQSVKLLLSMGVERRAMALGLALVAMITLPALALAGRVELARLAPIIAIVVATHIVLTLVNLRVVGEAGMGSQAVLPIVTLELFASGCRGAGIYAALDPYTGIPMPQVVAGTAMNAIRFGLMSGVRSSLVAALMCAGIAVGSFATYIFGNLLVASLGLNSPKMPLYRWLPTVVWMSTIYSGSPQAVSLAAVAIGVASAAIMVLISSRTSWQALPFVVGMTLPPDIGLLALAAYAVKRAVMKLGVEAHERLLSLSSLALVGCGAAIAVYAALSVV